MPAGVSKAENDKKVRAQHAGHARIGKNLIRALDD
jgi:hypothetical protein